MKIYTPGERGIVVPRVMAALGGPVHHLQAHVFIPAANKQQAAQLSTSCGVTVHDGGRQLQEASGTVLAALQEADVLQEGAIYLTRMYQTQSPVVRLAPGGYLAVIGLLLSRGALHNDPTLRFYPTQQPSTDPPRLHDRELEIADRFGYNQRWDRFDDKTGRTPGGVVLTDEGGSPSDGDLAVGWSTPDGNGDNG